MFDIAFFEFFYDVYCSGETPALYTVIPEKAASVGGAMMGSAHVYELGSAAPAAAAGGTAIKKVCVCVHWCSLLRVCVCMCFGVRC